DGQGVHLASVVALQLGGPAVSALTNPDGTYRMEGVPPGQYVFYVHPLPPARQSGLGPADIVLPLDADNRVVAAGGLFETSFFPGTKDARQAVPSQVNAGLNVDGVNFFVQRRTSIPIHSVSTYSFFDQTPVKPGYLNASNASGTLVAAGTGLTANGILSPGL